MCTIDEIANLVVFGVTVEPLSRRLARLVVISATGSVGFTREALALEARVLVAVAATATRCVGFARYGGRAIIIGRLHRSVRFRSASFRRLCIITTTIYRRLSSRPLFRSTVKGFQRVALIDAFHVTLLSSLLEQLPYLE